MDNPHYISWIPVPGTPYIMKYAFYNFGYELVASNLTSLYFERLDHNDVLKRFQELNQFVHIVKPEVVLDSLKKGLEKALTEEICMDTKLVSDKLVVSIEYTFGTNFTIPCRYSFKLELNAEKLTEYVICPTIFYALLTQRKMLAMQKINSQSASSSAVPVPDPINPDWLKGKNVSTESLVESFLKIQNFCKELEAENLQAYKKEESKSHHFTQSMSVKKKMKPHENPDDGSKTIKFEDSDERTSIKREETMYSDESVSQIKPIVKKKVFKF